MSAAVAGVRLRARLAQTSFGWRQPLAALLAAAAAATPFVAAGFWINSGSGSYLRTRCGHHLAALHRCRDRRARPGPHGRRDPRCCGPGRLHVAARSRPCSLVTPICCRTRRRCRSSTPRWPILLQASASAQQMNWRMPESDMCWYRSRLTAPLARGSRPVVACCPQNASGSWRVWEVQSDAGRLAVAASGATSANDEWQLPGDPVGVGRNAAPVKIPFSLSPRYLVLAEAPSGAWQAKAVVAAGAIGVVGAVGAAGELGQVGAGAESSRTPGTALEPATVDGMQAFVLPRTAADVVVFRTPDRRANWLVLELVVLVVALLGAVPAGGRSQEEQRPGRSDGLGAEGFAEPVETADVDGPVDPNRFSPPEPARA